MKLKTTALLALCLAALLLVAGAGQAAFPGRNGLQLRVIQNKRTATLEIAVVEGALHFRSLTHNSVDDLDPAWSPDGRKIAFARSAGASTVGSDIFLMTSSGQAQIQLTQGSVASAQISMGSRRSSISLT